jgi:hypothetical protein
MRGYTHPSREPNHSRQKNAARAKMKNLPAKLVRMSLSRCCHSSVAPRKSEDLKLDE